MFFTFVPKQRELITCNFHQTKLDIFYFISKKTTTFIKPSINSANMKVLILCTGNSCWNQMAHGYLQSFDERISVFSGGTEPAGHINSIAVKVMSEIGIDISKNTPNNVSKFIDQEWDYVITVCGGANELCPTFNGTVKNRLHIGFEDPSHATGSDEFIMSEYYRVRNEIKKQFHKLFIEDIKHRL